MHGTERNGPFGDPAPSGENQHVMPSFCPFTARSSATKPRRSAPWTAVPSGGTATVKVDPAMAEGATAGSPSSCLQPPQSPPPPDSVRSTQTDTIDTINPCARMVPHRVAGGDAVRVSIRLLPASPPRTDTIDTINTRPCPFPLHPPPAARLAAGALARPTRSASPPPQRRASLGTAPWPVPSHSASATHPARRWSPPHTVTRPSLR